MLVENVLITKIDDRLKEIHDKIIDFKVRWTTSPKFLLQPLITEFEEEHYKLTKILEEYNHMIEFNNLSRDDKVNICDRIHNIRQERRALKQNKIIAEKMLQFVLNGNYRLRDLEYFNTLTQKYVFNDPLLIKIARKNIKSKRAKFIEVK